MAPKRTGLGRGIGALIPTATEQQNRPVDVFFPTGGSPASAPTAEDLVAVPGARLANLNPLTSCRTPSNRERSSAKRSSRSSCTRSARSACSSRSSYAPSRVLRVRIRSTSSSWASAVCARRRSWASARSRRSSRKPPMTRCSAMLCSRICTGRSSTRSKRPRRTSSSSLTSGSPRSSSPRRSADRGRRSPTRSDCCVSPPRAASRGSRRAVGRTRTCHPRCARR